MTDPTPEWMTKLSSYLYEAIQAGASPETITQHRLLTEAAQAFIASAIHLVEAVQDSARLLGDHRPAHSLPPAELGAQMLLPMLHYADAAARAGPGGMPGLIARNVNLDIGRVLVDERLQVLEMNSRARVFLESPSNTFTLVHDRLSVEEPRTAHALQKMVTQACSARDPQTAGELALLIPGSRELAFGLIVTAAPAGPETSAGGRPIQTVWLTLRDAFTPLCPELGSRLQNLLGFTRKEAELAIALLSGVSLQQAAQERGVRLSTIRSQLASLFRKTGTTHQSQLVALLSRLCTA